MRYIEGDEIPKPPTGGQGNGLSPRGNGIDDFIFSLDPDDFKRYLWDELALPNQDDAKAILDQPEFRKAGYSTDGSPSNLALTKTAKNAYARRIAFTRPSLEDLQILLDMVNNAKTEEELIEATKLLEEMQSKMAIVPWIDPLDVKYYAYKKEMRPKFNAVMFALMDVSGSMTEYMKDLAKRFYILLYSFLKARYERVEIVFIRHTHEAKEVDEKTFFYDPETGGTVVSKALELMRDIIQDRFPLDSWNIYVAQCSDGDNSDSDNIIVDNLLKKEILPIVQHFVYIEVARNSSYNSTWLKRESDLWKLYQTYKHMSVFDKAKLAEKHEVWNVMIQLYSKNKENV